MDRPGIDDCGTSQYETSNDRETEVIGFVLHFEQNEQDGEGSEERLELGMIGWHSECLWCVHDCDRVRRSLLTNHVLEQHVQDLVRQLAQQEHDCVQLSLKDD